MYSAVLISGLQFFLGWPALQTAALVMVVAMIVPTAMFRWLRRR